MARRQRRQGISQILSFTQDGKFRMQSGHYGKNAGSNDPAKFRARGPDICRSENQRGLCGGRGHNRRVVCADADTETLKRFWGAYGNKPDDGSAGTLPPPRRCSSSAARRACERRRYVCDRQHDRVQAGPTAPSSRSSSSPKTLASGSTWKIAFSKDPGAAIYVPDRRPTERVRIVERDRVTESRSAAADGSPANSLACTASRSIPRAQFHTTETYEGKRVQKFVSQGIGKVPPGDQGAVWPKRGT